MAVGTLLDGDTLRITLSQPLGLRVCRPYKCRCGATIDEFSSHDMSCRFSAGRHSRHAVINDVIQPVVNTAGFPSQLESMGDGKWPNRSTAFPFACGLSLILDATCCDTLSQTGIVLFAVQPGSCLKKRKRKSDKILGSH